MLNSLECLFFGFSGVLFCIFGALVESQPTTIYGLLSAIICLVAQFLLYYFGNKKGGKK